MAFNAINAKNEIITWLKEYKANTGCEGVVLGVSGGKDSTVVAMLAKAVWGNNVFGVLMPNGNQIDLQDSKNIVNTLGMKHKIVNIGSAYNALLGDIEDENLKVTAKAKTNVPPRLRMATLYAIAQTLDYRVIGTGNASEGYIGWTTKWGDGAHDLNPIAHLTCSEVIAVGKELAKDFGLDEKYVNKAPSDGLTGKSDEDNFGFTYAELDRYIRGEDGVSAQTKAKIEKLHAISEHKRKMPYRM